LPTSDVSPRWDGSAAHKQLETDVLNEVHSSNTPEELWKTREEFQDFPLEVFRKHVWQATKMRDSNKYFANVKNKKSIAIKIVSK